MFRAHWTAEKGWEGKLVPYGPLNLLPSAQVLNYGQSVFEGMKAQRSAKDRIVLFRPDRNAARMAAGKAWACGAPLCGFLPWCSLPLRLCLCVTETMGRNIGRQRHRRPGEGGREGLRQCAYHIVVLRNELASAVKQGHTGPEQRPFTEGGSHVDTVMSNHQ
jgi:hypothetical protein